MSTKGSIFYESSEPVPVAQYTHIYTECFDEGPITPVYVEQGRDSVSLTIPMLRDLVRHVQRQVTWANERASETDAAIEARVQDAESKRTRHHLEWVAAGSPKSTALSFLAHGGDEPEAERVRDGIQNARKFRDECRAALAVWNEETR